MILNEKDIKAISIVRGSLHQAMFYLNASNIDNYRPNIKPKIHEVILSLGDILYIDSLEKRIAELENHIEDKNDTNP